MIKAFNEIDHCLANTIREGYLKRKNYYKTRESRLRDLALHNIRFWLYQKADVLRRFNKLDKNSFQLLDELGEWFILFEVYDGNFLCFMHEAESGSIRHKRAILYRTFFEKIISESSSISRNFRFFVYIKDVTPLRVSGFSEDDIPFFCFQKQSWSHGITIPDIDLLSNSWYEDFIDKIEFRQKINMATFSGSTTGINDHSGLTGVTEESIEKLTLPRIRAAEYLQDAKDVIFRLPNTVQCKSSEIIQSLSKKDYTKSRLTIQESLDYKFLLSIDGNGANCSRVAIGLKSNCALIKYESVMELYYFGAMQKMRHYIPITSEYQIRDIITLEEHESGLFMKVAVEGSKFFDDYLSIWPTCKYTEELLSLYSYA